MIGDRPLQHVDDPRSAQVVVHRAEDASRLDGHHAHAELAAFHALDLGAEIDRVQQLHRDTPRLRYDLFITHVLSSRSPACLRRLSTRGDHSSADTSRLSDSVDERRSPAWSTRLFWSRVVLVSSARTASCGSCRTATGCERPSGLCRAKTRSGDAGPGRRRTRCRRGLRRSGPHLGRRLGRRGRGQSSTCCTSPLRSRSVSQARGRADRAGAGGRAPRAAGRPRAGVQRVVLTSSMAAIGYGQPPRTAPFTEDDWTDVSADVSAYTKSKTSPSAPRGTSSPRVDPSSPSSTRSGCSGRCSRPTSRRRSSLSRG